MTGIEHVSADCIRSCRSFSFCFLFLDCQYFVPLVRLCYTVESEFVLQGRLQQDPTFRCVTIRII